MAGATLAMVFVAAVSAAISFFQWEEMQKSIDAANRQATAAEAANKIASESIIAANRPWIGLLSAVSAKPVAGQVFKATVTLKNSGHEPAINVRGILNMTVEANGDIEKRATPDCAFCSHSIALPENALVASVEFDAGGDDARVGGRCGTGKKAHPDKIFLSLCRGSR